MKHAPTGKNLRQRDWVGAVLRSTRRADTL